MGREWCVIGRVGCVVGREEECVLGRGLLEGELCSEEEEACSGKCEGRVVGWKDM